MTKRELSEGLAAAARVRRDELLSLAEDIAERERVEVIASPSPSSVMIELTTSIGPFCFTEAVVTTARVRTRNGDGWGAVMGWDAQGALAGALCDAAGGEHAAALARHALDDEASRRRDRMRAVAATKV